MAGIDGNAFIPTSRLPQRIRLVIRIAGDTNRQRHLYSQSSQSGRTILFLTATLRRLDFNLCGSMP
jgi:hypothetical protein